MKKIVIPVLVAGALLTSLAGTASAREGNAPLVSYGGCHRLVGDDPMNTTDWDCMGADSSGSSTVEPGVWVQARWPGWCTQPGSDVRIYARPFHRVRCG